MCLYHLSGMQAHDSTMALVVANAAAVARAAGVQAPGEQCGAGCWLADRESGRQQCAWSWHLWFMVRVEITLHYP